jgi:hypothetical protein
MPLFENEIATINNLSRATIRNNVQVLVVAEQRKLEKRWYVTPTNIILFGKPNELLYVKTACGISLKPARYEPVYTDTSFSKEIIKDMETGKFIIKDDHATLDTVYNDFFD